LCCFIWAINLNSRSAGKHRRRFMTLLLGFIYYVVSCRREEICKQNFGCKSRRDYMENLIVVRRLTIKVRKARKLKHMWCVQSVIIHIFPSFFVCILHVVQTQPVGSLFFFFCVRWYILIFSCFSGQYGFAIFPVLMSKRARFL